MTFFSAAVAQNGPATAQSVYELFRAGRFEEAVRQGRIVLADAERDHGTDSLEAADAARLLSLSMSVGRLGEKQERLALAQRAVETCSRILGPQDPSLMEAVYALGHVHYQDGDFASAAPHFRRSLAMADAYYGPYAVKTHDFVRAYGAALLQAGRYKEAAGAIERQVQIVLEAAGPDHPATLDARNDLARVYGRMGRYIEAEAVLRELVSTLESREPPDPLRLFRVLRTLSINLTIQGRFDEGLAAGEQALDIQETDSGIRPLDRARLLNNLAHSLLKIDDTDKAQLYLERSGQWLTGGSADPRTLLRYRTLLALLHREAGDLEKARLVLARGKAAAEGLVLESDPVWAAFHYYAGQIYRDSGLSDQAAASLRATIAVLDTAGSGGGFDTAEALRDLALVELDQGHVGPARQRLLEAAEIMEPLTGRSHPDFIRLLDGLAQAEEMRGASAGAIDLGLEAESLRTAHIKNTVAGLPERQALALAGQRRFGLDAALAVVLAGGGGPKGRQAVAETMIRSRAVVFDEMVLRSTLIRAGSDPERAALAEKLRTRKAVLSNLYVTGPGERPDWQLAETTRLRDQIEELETDLAGLPGMEQVRAGRRPVRLQELSNRLPRNGVLLSYIQHGPATGRRYAVMVLQGRGNMDPFYLDLGTASVIDQAVAAWRTNLDGAMVLGRDPTSAEETYRKAGSALRELVWDPVAANIGPGTRVYVVPDGAIHLVSFAALPGSGTAYLVEDARAFHYLTTERDLLRDATNGFSGGSILIVGDPDFADPGSDFLRGSGGTCNIGNLRFVGLPETRREARQVRKFWQAGRDRGEAVLLSRSRASEEEFRRRAAGMRVLHLATHGYFLDDGCASSSALRGIGGLSRDGDRPKAPASRPVPQSPLLLSGLVLAGANAITDTGGTADGILTAEEIASLDLSGVRLAVLSACRTGSGRVQIGEGLFGLRRAFLTAGAAIVVTNLWDVEDSAGREWVRAFYSGLLLRELPVPDAVREASLTLLLNRRSSGRTTHPFYWAGWLSTGSAG